MNPDRERGALKALLDLKDKPGQFVKSSRRWSLGYVAGGLALLSGMAVWNKHLNDAAYIILSFMAGILLALGYARYVESVGNRFVQPYLRRDDISARYEQLSGRIDDSRRGASIAKIIVFLLFVLGLVYGLLLLFKS